jgi:Lrp/AsnC family transcriptional regulator, leucine-responsive regulatory protein
MTTSQIDATDRRILAALQRNGRLQNQELAKLVGLSPSPCLRRVRRLEDEGYINRYGAVLDRAKLGFGITAFVSIEIERTRKAETELLREQILKLPDVVACHIITGDADFLLEIVAADLAAFSQFVLAVVNKLPAIKAIRTSISLEAVKASGPLPIDVPESAAVRGVRSKR